MLQSLGLQGVWVIESTFTDSPIDIPQSLRPMEIHDIPQVSRIDREAFPTLWPATPFEQDLRNKAIRYLVSHSATSDLPNNGTNSEEHDSNSQFRPEGFIARLKRFLGLQDQSTSLRPIELVTGFVGTWFITDEAHIIAIAVIEEYRSCGIGELLLMGTMELAMARRCRIVTLEVRASNTPAQNLYKKYGFRCTGLRKQYYSDNRENALVMTTDPLNTSASRRLLWDLMQAYVERYGQPDRILA
jgi:ribosomal-protein-alanine N-acetyltransferase